MRLPSRDRPEAEALRHQLTALAFETKLIRVQRSLDRKYDASQPRAPAGQSDGGQWVSGDGDGSIDGSLVGQGTWASLGGTSEDAGQETTRVRTVTEDGSRFLSIRIRAGRGEWDEQQTVTLPDGESRVFETSGATQTIRDGQSGEVLSRSTFTTSGIEPEATVQPAFLPALPFVVGPAVAATIEAAALLFTVLSARKDGFGTVLGMTAREYEFETDDDRKFPLVWVGRLDQAALDAACPRNAEVQAVTDETYARLTALNPLLTGQQLGNLLHFDIAGKYKYQDDPNMIPELSLDGDGNEIIYGRKGVFSPRFI